MENDMNAEDQSATEGSSTQETSTASDNTTEAPASETVSTDNAVNNSAPADTAPATDTAPPPDAPPPPPPVETPPAIEPPVVQPEPVELPAPAAPAEPQDSVQTNPVPPLQRFTAPAVQDTPAALGVGAIVVLQEIEDYIKTMSRKVTLSSEQGAVHQAQLSRVLVAALKVADADFKDVMDKVLASFHQERENIFSAAKAFRFMSHMKTRTPAEISTFKGLVNMFSLMADPNPKGRALAVKQVNFEATLNTPQITEQQRQRVLAYFNVK